MKILMFALLLTILLPVNFAAAQDNDKMTAAIRVEVAAINKNAVKYAKKKKNVDGIALEGAEATFYSSRKDLKKIAAKMYGETYNATAEFYYKGDEIIFALYKTNRYDAPIGAAKSPKIVSTEEKRFYFADGKLAKLLIDKTEFKPDSPEFKEAENDAADLSHKLRAEF